MAEPVTSKWSGKPASRLLVPATLLFCAPVAMAQDATTEIVGKLNAEIVKAVRMADVAAKIDGMGFVPVGNSADAFATSIKSEFEKWEVAIRENQIRLD